MLSIRHYRTEELPRILERGLRTALDQLVQRDRPAATTAGVKHQTDRMYQIALTTPQSTILVADWPGLPDPPAGHALLMPQNNPLTGDPEIFVLDIFTHPALRGRGVGKELLRAAETYARSVGCRSLAAQVALHNQSSMRMFLGTGYQQERVVVGKRLY